MGKKKSFLYNQSITTTITAQPKAGSAFGLTQKSHSNHGPWQTRPS